MLKRICDQDDGRVPLRFRGIRRGLGRTAKEAGGPARVTPRIVVTFVCAIVVPNWLFTRTEKQLVHNTLVEQILANVRIHSRERIVE